MSVSPVCSGRLPRAARAGLWRPGGFAGKGQPARPVSPRIRFFIVLLLLLLVLLIYHCFGVYVFVCILVNSFAATANMKNSLQENKEKNLQGIQLLQPACAGDPPGGKTSNEWGGPGGLSTS